MASDESGDSLLDSGIADDLSINGYEALFEQIQRMKAESGLTNRSGDPNQIMDESKRLQEEDYAGISGYLRYGAHQLYGRRWSEQDPALAAQEYENAKQAGATAGQHEAFNLSGDSNRNNLAALYAQLGDAAAVAMASSPIQGQILEVQQQYDRNLAYIKQFQNKKFTDFNGLFRSQTQLDNTLSELMRRASVVRDETVTRLQDHELAVQRDDADTLAALKLAGSGDTAGAQRMSLENQFNVEERESEASGDYSRLARLQEIHKQTMANFDAGATRTRKLEDAQANDEISRLHEEAHEAQLRSEGKNDEAQTDQLNFETEQRVRSLRERADAEGDSEKRLLLLKEADAAEEAGKTEREALRQQLQRSSSQSSAAPGTTHDAMVLEPNTMGKLQDVTKRLETVAAKIELSVAGPQKKLTTVQV